MYGPFTGAYSSCAAGPPPGFPVVARGGIRAGALATVPRPPIIRGSYVSRLSQHRRRHPLRPLPTGYLHVGGARTALFNWLLARHARRAVPPPHRRHRPGPQHRAGDDAAPRRPPLARPALGQRRAGLPVEAASTSTTAIIDDLIARGLAYKAYETPRRARRDAQGRREAEARSSSTAAATLTRRAGRAVRGRGPPARRAVRDAGEGIPLPRRGARQGDRAAGRTRRRTSSSARATACRRTTSPSSSTTRRWASPTSSAARSTCKNTFNHIALQEALGYPRPVYGHLPIILNPDGSKMGKRDRDKKIRQQARTVDEEHEEDRSTTSPPLAASRLQRLDRVARRLAEAARPPRAGAA